MEFHLGNDFLAVVSRPQYDEMQAKAKANDEYEPSTLEVTMGVVGSAVVIGAVGYMGYQMVTATKETNRRQDLYRQNTNLERELADLKARMERL